MKLDLNVSTRAKFNANDQKAFILKARVITIFF